LIISPVNGVNFELFTVVNIHIGNNANNKFEANNEAKFELFISVNEDKQIIQA